MITSPPYPGSDGARVVVVVDEEVAMVGAAVEDVVDSVDSGTVSSVGAVSVHATTTSARATPPTSKRLMPPPYNANPGF